MALGFITTATYWKIGNQQSLNGLCKVVSHTPIQVEKNPPMNQPSCVNDIPIFGINP
jgi:hypothetical protein